MITWFCCYCFVNSGPIIIIIIIVSCCCCTNDCATKHSASASVNGLFASLRLYFVCCFIMYCEALSDACVLTQVSLTLYLCTTPKVVYSYGHLKFYKFYMTALLAYLYYICGYVET